jgi:glycosyltransferase involved in cell wall biosynthesis
MSAFEPIMDNVQQPEISSATGLLGRERTDAATPHSGAPLSVIILSFNEETNLPACLDSIDGLRCVVFVLDSFSTDRTPQIAQDRGVLFHQHVFENYAVQRNWSQGNLPIQTPWVLHLDADERLTPELVTEINSLMDDPPADIHGFFLRKRTIFMGKWIRHGGHYPSYHLRLFRSASGRCEDRLYDQHFMVDGLVEKLNNDYLDIVASDLSTWTVRHARWARMEAREMLATQGVGRQVDPNFMGTPIERRRWLRNTYGRGPLLVRAFLYGCYRYFFRLGFLDGKEGLIFHVLQGFWFRFLVDSLICEQITTHE